MQAAGLLEHHHTSAGIECFHIEVSVLRQLRDRLRATVVLVDVLHAVAIGDEEHVITDPRRIQFLGVDRPRNGVERKRLEIEYPDRLVLATAIVATFVIPRAGHAIRDVCSGGIDVALEGTWHRHRLFGTTLGTDRPEALGRSRRARLTRAAEDHALPIGRPARDGVGTRMPGQPSRFATVDRDGVDIGVAGVRASEGDGATIGRQFRLRGVALK